MPYTTVMKKLTGKTWLDDIMCSALSAGLVDGAELEIAALMRERHHRGIRLLELHVQAGDTLFGIYYRQDF